MEKKIRNNWNTHWKKSRSLETSGTFLGNWLRIRRLELVKEIVKDFPKQMSVIDLGCGSGDTMLLFKNLGFKNITGIDFVESALNRCEKLGFKRNKNIFLMNARQTPFYDKSFDIVFSEGLWEHFPDPRRHMLEACRLSKKYVIVIQPNHFSPFGKIMQLGWTYLTKNKGGVKEYSFLLSYFQQFLEDNGFKLITSKSTPVREQSIMVFRRKEELLHYYNIHNLIKVCSNKPLNKLSYFKTDTIENVDITLRFGNFEYLNQTQEYKQVITDNSYFIGNHSLFCYDTHKISTWKIWFQNLDQKHTTIHFSGDPLFSEKVFFVLIFEPFLTYKLSQKGIFFLHSSSLSYNNKGIIFSGETGVGKTAILLALLAGGKAVHFADDQSIVKGKILLSYPIPIGLRMGLIHNNNLQLNTRDKLIIYLQSIVNRLTFYYGNLTHRVDVEDLGFQAGHKVKLKNIFLLNLGNEQKIQQLSPQEALPKLLAHNRGNEDKQKILFRYLTAYKQVYPDFSYWKDFEKLVKKLVNSNIQIHEIICKRYQAKRNLNDIIKIITQ